MKNFEITVFSCEFIPCVFAVRLPEIVQNIRTFHVKKKKMIIK